MIDASTMPSSDAVPVTVHVSCHPPTFDATQATSGGPANWPIAENCCIQPTVVET